VVNMVACEWALGVRVVVRDGARHTMAGELMMGGCWDSGGDSGHRCLGGGLRTATSVSELACVCHLGAQ